MGFSFFQIVVTDVDDVTADGLGRHQGQIVVLGTAVDAEVCLVDGSLINGVRNRLVDKLTVIQKTHGWKENPLPYVLRSSYSTVRTMDILYIIYYKSNWVD